MNARKTDWGAVIDHVEWMGLDVEVWIHPDRIQLIAGYIDKNLWGEDVPRITSPVWAGIESLKVTGAKVPDLKGFLIHLKGQALTWHALSLAKKATDPIHQ